MQIILRTWQEPQLPRTIPFLIQFVSKVTHNAMFSSASRNLTQVTESLFFKNVGIIRFCAKLRVHKRFRI